MKFFTFLLALLLFFGPAFSQTLSNYYSKYDLLLAPPSAFQDGLVGFANPATLGTMRAADARFYWTTDGPRSLSFNNWGLFMGGQLFGFGMQQKNFQGHRITDYSVSLGGGSDLIAIGFGYDWTNGDRAAFSRYNQIKVSAIVRPTSWLSFGSTGFWGTDTNQREALAELGVRPFASPRLTLFGDALLRDGLKVRQDYWSAGAVWQVVPGINLVGRYFGSEAFTVGLVLDLGNGSLSGQGHYSASSEHGYNSYMLRSGGFRNNVFQRLAKNVAYVPFSLKGVVDHQKFILFDDYTHRLYDLLRDVRAAANDPRISTIVINQSMTLIRPEHAWELRQELKAAQEKDKKIIIYIENAGMTGYHLASVADLVVMEPHGLLTLPGLVMGRTYLKGSLEKLGLGFDEWRFYSHKTAYETYSRDDLSEADEEQYNAYIDVWYNLIRKDVAASRSLSGDEFDTIINESFLLSGQEALKKGLVDKLDRWSNIEEIVKKANDNRALLKLPRSMLWDNAVLPEEWGPKPKIALVYGVGDAAMDTGIRARYLERVFKKLQNDHSVKAVVFRVESPGGPVMAGAVVADALKKCAAKKPVIISQGQVAASGGYWISIYGDKILAGPNTITGSIGVIGGWIWDKDLTDKLGITSDHVQRGEHADAMYGATLPLLGLSLPKRNLTDDERAKIEKWMRVHYEEFITEVANGRDMPADEVEKIAQGRFYAGADGAKNGLVDEIGGLMMAIDFARQDAGLEVDEFVEIVEIPKYSGLWQLFPIVTAKNKVESDPLLRYLKLIAENPYQPLHMLPPGTYPDLEK